MKLSRKAFHNFCSIGNDATFSPEDGDSIFSRNDDVYLRAHTVSQSRRTLPLHHGENVRNILSVDQVKTVFRNLSHETSFMHFDSSVYESL
jgi:hypothetical protein